MVFCVGMRSDIKNSLCDKYSMVVDCIKHDNGDEQLGAARVWSEEERDEKEKGRQI